MQRYESDFPAKLVGFDFKTIEESRDVIFGLSKNLKLIYFNEAWLQFSKNNNGEPFISANYNLGTLFTDAISNDLKAFYKTQYTKVLHNKKVWKHEYECSSPSLYRMFFQSVYPLKNGEGLIIVNSIKIEYAINKKPQLLLHCRQEADYIQSTGLINQCSNCRRTQRANDSNMWDWAPKLVTNMPLNISHGICPICYDYHWKFHKVIK